MSAGNGSSAGSHCRVASRFKVDALSYIDLGSGNGGMVIGVSESGLSFQGVQPLEDGQQVPVRFKLPGAKQSLSAAARVAWLNSSGKGGGLQFLEMPEESRSLLKDWLAERTSPEGVEKIAAPQIFDTGANLETFLPDHLADATPELPRAAVRERPAEAARDVSPSASKPLDGAFLPARGSLPGHSGSPLRASLANSPASSPLLATVRKFPSPLTAPDHALPSTTHRQASKVLPWLLVSAASLATLGAASFLTFRGPSASDPKVLSQSGDNSLGLKLERQGTDWQVRWNRNAGSVLKAIGGHLSITDGQSRKDLDLEPSELRGGSILYTPVTNDLLVRLQLVGGNSDTPASESVRILAGVTTPPFAAKPADTVLRRNADSTVVGISSVNSSLFSRSRPALRQLIALDLRTPRHPGGSVATPPSESGPKDSAASESTGPLSPAMPQAIDLSLHPALAPLRPGLGSSSLAPPGGNWSVIQAQLISGEDPVFPSSARGMGISGSVTVHFNIGKDGRVSDAAVVKGNPLFGRAAVDAVMARRYRPAMVAGVPAESETDAVFVFNPK